MPHPPPVLLTFEGEYAKPDEKPFPLPQTCTWLGIFENTMPAQKEAWNEQDMNTAAILYPPRPADYANPSVCAEFLLSTLEFLCPPEKEEFAPPEGEIRDVLPYQPASNNARAEPFYLVTGLNRNVAHTLRSQPAWSTRVGTFFVLPNPVPIPSFAVSLKNLPCRPQQIGPLRTEIIQNLENNANFINMVTAGAIDNNIDDVDALIDATLKSVDIKHISLPRGDNATAGFENRWNVYMKCPVPAERHAGWIKMIQAIHFKAKWGTGTKADPMRCTYCSGTDHQRSICDYPAMANWLDTEDTAPQALPGQSIAPVIAALPTQSEGSGNKNRGYKGKRRNGQGRGKARN
ncbi:hypothetical protein PUNSTDRAFT_134550 [Punctularia strigosozonata HHB-11173 SS5]|uniref:uncharacterized protein n=1 Tax=Punctularia strigosozonata (strain HHB-11173) TaxID=741275 RepID=UPI000441708B|nr:uncharacterized protein PUNSTDRAFT_134550 [Punctularia strigosozonata HHB-11173 SS5]EIN08153.1 hypothetical protein PUNSTDRAFT_134550 [Punctularia strigosozonata HHB-11173 SS5]